MRQQALVLRCASVKRMASALTAWGAAERQSLLRARLAQGHSQQRAAERLRALGCPGATQTAVSRWETGTVGAPRAATRLAIQRYVDEAPAGSLVGERREPDTAERSATSREAFDAAVRDLTHEPLLGELQRDFVLAQITRLREGPPLSESDDRARADLLRILQLG